MLTAIGTILNQRWIIGALFVLGVARGLFSLWAYPAARGADVVAYYFYAERLSGLDIPGLAQVVPPFYPILLLIFVKWLNAPYLLIAFQLVLSAAIAPLYYDAIRRVDARLALLVSLVILFDFQTAVIFNFLSTEPLYVFLLALAFNLLMRASRRDPAGPLITPAAAGISVALLLLTRAVARFLMIPIGLVFWLQTRSWKRTLALVGGFGATLLAYSLFSQLTVNQVEGVNSSTYMVTDVVLRNNEWLKPENGPATAEFLELQEACQAERLRFYTCYEYQRGTIDGLIPLILNTTIETVQVNFVPYTLRVWDNLNRFLKLSGQQLGFDPDTPSAVQCNDPDGWVDSITLEATRGGGWNWAWGARSYIDNHFEDFKTRLRFLVKVLCPPLPDSPAAREVVDFMTFRYRSLGRPNPMLWYGGLIVLTLAIPAVRRKYLTLVLMGSAFLFNHALASAMIDNVQPRYVVVTNPFRALLLVTLIYIVLNLLWRIVERVWVRRSKETLRAG